LIAPPSRRSPEVGALRAGLGERAVLDLAGLESRGEDPFCDRTQLGRSFRRRELEQQMVRIFGR